MPDNKNDFRITSYSIFLILLLCIIWPLLILLFFKPLSSISPGEIGNPVLQYYLPTIGIQLVVFLIVILVCRYEGSSLKQLGFRSFRSIHILYAIIFFFASSIILRTIKDILIGLDFFEFQSPSELLPHTIFERIIWVFLCIIVAFNEESAYRGYLITRLSKITKSTVLAVLIACTGFAAGHLYQGTGQMILIFFYGLMFAGLYLATRSLWPCVIAHFINNAIVIFSGSVLVIRPFW